MTTYKATDGVIYRVIEALDMEDAIACTDEVWREMDWDEPREVQVQVSEIDREGRGIGFPQWVPVNVGQAD